jgi:outer membrane protein TolC
MKRLAFLLFAHACLSWAADYPDLPPTAQVAQALSKHPLVRAAEAGVGVSEANRDLLDAGSHEFAVRLASQRRQDRTANQHTREHEIGIERAIRLPGKAALDAQIGAVGMSQAQYALGDAMHESGRLLLGRWFEWQRETAAARDWQAQVDILRTQHVAVLKKVGAGETAKLEAQLSKAQLTQAEAQLAQAQTRRERAAVELQQHFPDIRLPEHVPLLSPAAMADVQDAPAHWRERILAENHELAVARSAARRSRLEADRIDAERLPDPTLGLTYGRERDGQERIVGLQITIPLPGAARAASVRAANAESDAAVAREALALARAEAEARQTINAALSSHTQWRRLAEVAQRMEENARLLEKAWRLGEGQFIELQTARRQSIEARLTATQAQLDANEARYRLLLDAHKLWEFTTEDDPSGHHKDSLTDRSLE